jgi:hypothetical protein
MGFKSFNAIAELDGRSSYPCRVLQVSKATLKERAENSRSRLAEEFSLLKSGIVNHATFRVKLLCDKQLELDLEG